MSTTSTASSAACAHRMHSDTVGGFPSSHSSCPFCNEFHRVVVNATTGTFLARASGNRVRSALVCAMLYRAINASSSHSAKSGSSSSSSTSAPSSFPSPMNPRPSRCDRSSRIPAHLSCVLHPTKRTTPSTPARPPSPTTNPPSFRIQRIASTASASSPLATYSRKKASI